MIPVILHGPFEGCHSLATACLSQRTAQVDDIDEQGHVNNAVYVRWIQDAATSHWQALHDGDQDKPGLWVCRRHEIDYRREILVGEEVEIRTWLGEAKGAQFARYTDIRKAGADGPAAEAVTWWVLIDPDTRRPRRVDRRILTRFGLQP